MPGCGGGGGGTEVSGNLALFVTDDLSTNYDHVWVTIHEVELEGSSGSTNVFNSSAGIPVDLRSLNDGSSLFSLLGTANVPDGNYTIAKVKMAKGLTLFSTGATTGTNVEFIDALDSGTGKVLLNVPLAGGLSVVGNTNLVLDFDLSQWTEAAGKVTPVVVKGSGSGIDDSNNHVSEDFKGTISGISGAAPNLTFGLSGIRVKTTSSTVIFREDGAGSAQLSNGQLVEVEGKFDTANHIFVASKVKIEDGATSGEDKAKGVIVGSISASGGVMTIEFARGFVPGATTLNLTFGSSTVYFNSVGLPIPAGEFFALLGDGNYIEVEGTVSVNNLNMTVRKAKIEDDGNNQLPEVKGNVVSINSGAGTFVITPTEWYGLSLNPSVSLTVTTQSAVKYKDIDGNVINKTQFFAALQVGGKVKVEGNQTPTGFSAIELQIRDVNSSNGGGGANESEIRGGLVSKDFANLTLVVRLSSWTGFAGSLNSEITVKMNSNATYRLGNSEVTASEFFSSITIGSVVESEGIYSGSQLAARKAKLDD